MCQQPVTGVTVSTAAADAVEWMVGSSPGIRRVREYTAKVAAMDCNVVIAGETGTGKELVAQALHRASRRAAKPLLALNCAAIPDSLFESELFGYERGAFTGAVATTIGKLQRAEGGTVFFDELEELSPLAQAKLLRAIETREAERLGGRGPFRINVRVIAATNQDLAELTESGRFRKDLYYRLAVVTIAIPPLRDRRDDIPSLAAHFLREINRDLGASLGPVSGDALEALQAHHWPGNVRELRNVLEAVAVEKQAGAILRADLPAWFRPPRKTFTAGPSEERTRMITALESASWNKAKAARQLSWSRMTLYRKMAKHEVGPGKRPTLKMTAGQAG